MADHIAAGMAHRSRFGAGWYWLRTLPENPIYLREKGTWGRPNPFYNKLSRYLPLVIIGAIVFAICAGTGTGFSNPALLMGYDEPLAILFNIQGWLLFKLFNSFYLWFLILGLLGLDEVKVIVGSSFMPSLVYLVVVVSLLAGIAYRAERVYQL